MMKYVTCICGLAAALIALVSHLDRISLDFATDPSRSSRTQAGLAETVPVNDDEEACLGSHHQGPTFETNRADLADAGLQAVAQFVGEVRNAPCILGDAGRTCIADEAAVELAGHTDERLTSRIGGNELLSLHRAQALESIFVSYGIPVRSVVGMAATQPAPAPVPDTRSEEERWRSDRRVTIRLWCEQ